MISAMFVVVMYVLYVTLFVLSSTSTASVFFLDSVIRALIPKYLNFHKDFITVVRDVSICP